MKPWSPSFDPSKDSLSSAPVWVRLPNLPLHLWDLSSLRSIGNVLGRFHFRCPEIEKYNIYMYARICVEMDFSKGFLDEIILTGDNYSWNQKLDYEKIALRCRACFSMGHLATQCPRGPKKARKQRKSTWWVGSHIDHQLISKDVSSNVAPPMEGSKEAPLKASFAPSIGDSPVLNLALDGSKSEIEDLNVTLEIIELSKMQQETPQKLVKKEDLDSPDSGKDRQAHPNFIPLESWEDEAIEAEALVTRWEVQAKVAEILVQEKQQVSDQDNPRIIGISKPPTSTNEYWLEVMKIAASGDILQ
jgi:hypothetical protein